MWKWVEIVAEWAGELRESQVFLLKDHCENFPIEKLSLSSSSSKGFRDIHEKLNCQASSWGMKGSFLLDRSVGRGHYSFVEPSQTQHADEGSRHIWISTNLANTVNLALVIPWDLTPSKSWVHLSHFQLTFHKKGLSWLVLKIFLKSTKGSQNLNEHHLASPCPVHLDEQPKDQH